MCQKVEDDLPPDSCRSYHQSEYAAAFGVDPGSKIPDDFSGLASYLFRCLLGFSGRRASCLVGIQFDHLRSFNGFREIVIPSSKGGARNITLPLNPLWPDYALNAFDRFVDLGPQLLDPVDRTSQLSDIAGMGTYTRKQVQQFQSALSAHLKSVAPSGGGSTHVGRIGWYSWMPIRILCAQNPRLLGHPLLKDVVAGLLFDSESLERLRELFSESCGDVLFLLKRLADHSSDSIPAEHYIRSLHLLATLHHDLHYGW